MKSIPWITTLKPYRRTSTLNPLRVLLDAGYPPEKLHILITGREPLHTWASWATYWKKVTNLERFILAYKTTEMIRGMAYEHGIPVTCYVYEMFINNPVENVFKKLFQRLDLVYTPYAISAWDKLPAFGTQGSNIVLPEEPLPFITKNLHTSVEKASCFTYNNKSKRPQLLPEEDIEIIRHEGLFDIYDIWSEYCQNDLEILL